MYKKLFWPVFIIITAVYSGILVWSNSGGQIRQVMLFLFILIGPGMALIPLLRLNDFLSEFVLSIALSLALSTFFAGILLLTHLWSPPAELAILIGISLLGANIQIRNVLKKDIVSG